MGQKEWPGERRWCIFRSIRGVFDDESRRNRY